MIRGIPPRTMSDVSRLRRPRWPPLRGSNNHPIALQPGPPRSATPMALRVTPPREWRYQTRPSFKRVRGPLVDVFNEAEEVLIVVDLGGFTRGEISLSMTPHQYVIRAGRGDQRFEEIIDLPPNVDLDRARERLVYGVLEIVLPTQAKPRPEKGPPRKRR